MLERRERLLARCGREGFPLSVCYTVESTVKEGFRHVAEQENRTKKMEMDGADVCVFGFRTSDVFG